MCIRDSSNDLTLAEYGPRIFDETVALREIGREVRPLAWKTRLRLGVRGVIGDSMRILQDPDFSWKRRVYWLVKNPRFHILKWRFFNLAANHDLHASAERSSFSLEGACLLYTSRCV